MWVIARRIAFARSGEQDSERSASGAGSKLELSCSPMQVEVTVTKRPAINIVIAGRVIFKPRIFPLLLEL